MLSSADLLHQKVLQTILDHLPEDERETPVVLWLQRKLKRYERKSNEDR